MGDVMDFIKENWELIKKTVKKEYDLTDISFNTWIMPLRFHTVENDIVKIIILINIIITLHKV